MEKYNTNIKIAIKDICIKNIDSIKVDQIGLIDYIDIASVDNKYKTIYNFKTIDIKDAPSRAKQIIKKNDILVSTVRPNLNAVAINNLISSNIQVCSTGFCVLRPKEYVLPSYLFNFCKSDLFINEISRQATGASYPAVNSRIIKNCQIPLPSLGEQKRIAAIMDKATELIALRKQQLEKLDLLVKSRFIEMFGDPVENPFGWPTRPLLNMGYCKNGMNFHTGDSGIEIHCLGVGDFKDYSIIDGTDHLPKISLKETPPEESMLKDGDILFVRSNGNKALVGRSLVVYPRNTPTTYSGFCIRYRLTSGEVNRAYLLRVLKTDSMRTKMAGRGANIQNLNQQILATLDIPTPPIDLQEQFSTFVTQSDKSKSTLQQSLEKLELNYKALMQTYFG